MRNILIIISLLIFNSKNLYAQNLAHNVFDLSFTMIDNQSIELQNFKGKLLFISNGGDLCGFTKEYFDLEDLWYKYSKYGLIVIAIIPENSDMKCYSHLEPISYIIVNDNQKSQIFFDWIAKNRYSREGNIEIVKYLFSPFGELISAYGREINTLSPSILSDIERNLPPIHDYYTYPSLYHKP